MLESALRMRPDRILLQELRDGSAFYYLRNVNSGHPGSITTVHANSCALAVEQLTLLVKESDGGRDLTRADIRELVHATVDVVVQCQSIGGAFKVVDVALTKNTDSARAAHLTHVPCSAKPLTPTTFPVPARPEPHRDEDRRHPQGRNFSGGALQRLTAVRPMRGSTKTEKDENANLRRAGARRRRSSRGGRVSVGALRKRLQKCHRLVGLGSGRKDGAAVGFEELKVLGDVLGVIGAWRAGDPEFGRDKGGTQFGDNFFGGIGGIAKAFAEVAVETGFRAAPVAKLVGQNRHVAFVTRHRRGSAEAGFVRHPDGVGGRLIEGPVTAVRNHGAGCSHEGIEALSCARPARDQEWQRAQESHRPARN